MEHFDMNKEYTNEDFDRMLVPLYDANGHPYLDEYEYIDAKYTNDEVERLRYVYFRQKEQRKKEQVER
ncbi:MAG: hypothetical protein PHY23_10015 [Oscillospiraceae bacterium]|nr:hypothetical protein [Oscillospiraceae bacterium]